MFRVGGDETSDGMGGTRVQCEVRPVKCERCDMDPPLEMRNMKREGAGWTRARRNPTITLTHKWVVCCVKSLGNISLQRHGGAWDAEGLPPLRLIGWKADSTFAPSFDRLESRSHDGRPKGRDDGEGVDLVAGGGESEAGGVADVAGLLRAGAAPEPAV